VLAGSGISNTGTTIVAGDIGSFPTPAVTELGGRTLTPGVYSATMLQVTGVLTLDTHGDPNAVFVFQTSTLVTASTAATVRGRLLALDGTVTGALALGLVTAPQIGTASTLAHTPLLDNTRPVATADAVRSTAARDSLDRVVQVEAQQPEAAPTTAMPPPATSAAPPADPVAPPADPPPISPVAPIPSGTDLHRREPPTPGAGHPLRHAVGPLDPRTPRW
jgi:hypothetical protein